MVKHMIIWKLKEEVTDRTGCSSAIKRELEGLVGKIDGLTEMRILTEGLPSSAGDIMMDSTFVSFEALQAYSKHPLHVAVADTFVRPYTAQRLSFDYEA